ncbi:aldehyde oxidoreductase [Aequitasia blattaphilus]|uniref:Molybdopterin-dependent oxidoreductase n=1 Tax=Aequitasia blattaphilus TaxID=2949332 RepID=A0ABT1E8D6_9FIRM|nr:molybdopterin-dependent aldehyde oxidoreductase [Aequitasia blattaphilus]MCP1102089.1 molybdopterin-dependent oxidoreductase [Aequitasia blattaphilus]MCR8614729.1 molybdopterin-dependent oxidoreductase [Aequitasia blattaphilus]
MDKRVLIVNGIAQTVIADGESVLSDVLRAQMHLTGCKVGCGNGQCGACSIIMDGKVVRACTRKMKNIPDNTRVETIEGIGTPEDLHPLQVAWMAHGCAQCGFCSPGFIMSSLQLLRENDSPTREEVREWFQKNRNACRCTGYKPLVNAVMDAAKVMRGEMKKEDLLFKPTDNKITGTYYHRPSGVAKVTGTWNFGGDIALGMPPGSLHLGLVQAKVSHGLIKGIDFSEAEKMPGVYKVITHKDVKGKNRINGLITYPSNKGDGWDRPILCDEKVFQFGDVIAMVAADTPEQARAAAATVVVDIEPLPAYMNALDAMADDAIEIHPGTPNVYFQIDNKKGEFQKIDAIFENAATVAEVDGYSSRQPHLPLEPDCGQAYIDEEGRLAIHSKSIGIHLHAAMVAEGIGVPMEKLRIIQNPAGGTFGYKFSPTMEGLLGVACLACDNRPVSLVYDMYQMITYTGKRSPTFAHMELAMDESGKILGLRGKNILDHGAYSEFGDLLTLRLAQYHCAGYDIPSIHTENLTVCTNHAWGSAFRGYGAPEISTSSEVLIDIAAEACGMDPFEFRYKNVYRPGCTNITGQVPEVFSLPEMMDKIKPKYYEAVERCKKKNEESTDLKYGVGLSLGIYGCGLDGVDSSEAFVELLPNNKILVGSSWEDHGQGADLGALTMAHETLRKAGIKPEDIQLIMNDMAKTPNSGPAGGSRSNVVTGNAIRVGAELLLKAMDKGDGGYYTYEEMTEKGIPTHYDGKWAASMCSNCDMETAQGAPFSNYMYELFLPEVEVDTKTGKVRVISFHTVADIGTVINRATTDGQIYGGIAQGIGLALTEDFEDLEKHTTLAGCGLPYIKDVPDNFTIEYVETPRESGPYGASGVGEAPLSAPHPAILNAIYNACGARITAVPARPEKVLEALADR